MLKALPPLLNGKPKNNMPSPVLLLTALPKALPSAVPQGALYCAWGCRAVPQGWLSLPALVDHNNDSLRAAVAAWAFECGISHARLHGRSTKLATWLEGRAQGAQPALVSAWWTSLLYERHPAMTDFLHDLCCLRVLEQQLEARAIQHLIVGTVPPNIRNIVQQFCNDTGRTCTLLAAAQVTAQAPMFTAVQAKTVAQAATTARAQAPPEAAAQAAFKAQSTTLAHATTAKAQHSPTAKAQGWRALVAPLSGLAFTLHTLKACALGAVRRLPAPVLALVRLCHWLVCVRRHFPLGTPLRPQGTATPRPVLLVSYFPAYEARAAARGQFRSPYWRALHDVLDQSPRPQQHLFIRANAPHEPLAHAVARCRLWNSQAQTGAGFHYLEEFLPPKAMFAACRRFCRIAVRAALLKKHLAAHCFLPHSRLNFWLLARKSYAESFMGWRGLERCLQAEACMRYVAWLGQPALALFPLENCPWERMLTHALRCATDKQPPAHSTAAQQASPAAQPTAPNSNTAMCIIGVQHSTLRPTDWRYFDDPRFFTHPATQVLVPDKLVLNGEHAGQQLLKAGTAATILYHAEALRFQHNNTASPCPDNFSPIKQSQCSACTAQPYAQSIPSTERHSAPAALPPAGSIVLLLTSFFAQESRAHLALLGQAWQQGALAHCRFVLKCHPWLDARPLLHSLCPPALHSHIEYSTLPLPQLFALAQQRAQTQQGSVLVWCSNSTSAAVDTVLAGLPLLVHLPPSGFNLCPLAALPQLPYASTVHDVAAALRQPCRLSLPHDWLHCGAGTAQWQALLAKYLSPQA